MLTPRKQIIVASQCHQHEHFYELQIKQKSTEILQRPGAFFTRNGTSTDLWHEI